MPSNLWKQFQGDSFFEFTIMRSKVLLQTKRIDCAIFFFPLVFFMRKHWLGPNLWPKTPASNLLWSNLIQGSPSVDTPTVIDASLSGWAWQGKRRGCSFGGIFSVTLMLAWAAGSCTCRIRLTWHLSSSFIFPGRYRHPWLCRCLHNRTSWSWPGCVSHLFRLFFFGWWSKRYGTECRTDRDWDARVDQFGLISGGRNLF